MSAATSANDTTEYTQLPQTIFSLEKTAFTLQVTVRDYPSWGTVAINEPNAKLTCSGFSSGIKHLEDEWVVDVYPNGLTHVGYLAAYLRLTKIQNDRPSIKAALKMAFIKRDGSYHDCFTDNPQYFNYTLDSARGYYNLIAAATLLDETNGYLHEKDLRIQIWVTIEHTKTVTNHKLRNGNANVLSKKLLGAWLQGGEGDLQIMSGESNKPLHAHKFVLSAWSPVFKAMFSTQMKESITSILEIPDASTKAVHAMLRFLYGGEVERDIHLAHELLHLADKYELRELKDGCADILLEQLTVSNASHALELTTRYQVSTVELSVLNYIRQNMDEIKSLDSFQEMCRKNPDIALRIFV